jgi:hypothetical protein
LDTTANGYEGSFAFGLSYIVGIEERTEDQWVLKPNPARDEFTVSELYWQGGAGGDGCAGSYYLS